MNREYTRAPHRTPEVAPAPETAALLIDFDNVTMGIRSNLGQELRRLLDSDIIRGKVAVQRAYADWRRYPQYIVPLSEASIDLIFAPAYGSSKKNATDIRMAIDGLELVFTRPEIGTFILLTGDSDFSSLVLKLKEYGKYVIGVGLQESASDILVQNCDEYYSYNQVSGLVSASDVHTTSHDPWVLVSKAIRRMAERGDVMRSDRLKQVMLEIDQTFDEKSEGFSKFNRFLAEATHMNLIEMRKGQNGQYEVAPGPEVLDGGDASAPAPPVQKKSSGRSRRGGRSRSDSSRSGGRKGSGGHSKPSETPAPSRDATGTEKALQEAYEALGAVVDDLYDGDAPVRDSMAKRKLIARDSGFDEGGLGFPKFSLFLKQAAEDGAITLEQRQDGNFYLTPASGDRKRSSARSTTGTTQAPTQESTTEERPRRGLLGRLLGGGRQKAAPEPAPAPEPEPEKKSGRDTQRQERGQSERASSGSGERSGSGRGRGRQSRGRGGAKSGREQDRRPDRSGGGSRDSGRADTSGRKDTSSRSGGDRSRQGGSRGRDDRSGKGRDARGDRSQRDRQPAARDAKSDRDGRDRDRKAKDDRPKRDRQSRDDRPNRDRESRPRREQTPTAGPTATPEPTAESSEPQPRRLGRYRSGSKGRAPAKPAGSGTTGRIGPLPREGDDTGAKADSKAQPKPESKPTKTTSSGGDARRSVRGRGGSKSPSSAPAKERESAPAPKDRKRESSGSGEAPKAIDHMVRNYAGVGKRTAEVLVEHFGAGVFEVIDSDPGRLTEVLSDGRAKAVIAAREQEREG